MKRRHLFLTVLGLQIKRQLAQTTPRKLALLVGINQYPNSFRFTKLEGRLPNSGY